LIASWHRAGRTVAAVLHDLDQVRANFPCSLLLARECVAWGPTRDVLDPHNLRRAREMSETWPAELADDERIPSQVCLRASR
jgi:zinc/manganese transport system ATP-binding protein